MNQTEHVSRYAWWVVGLLWVVALLNYLDRLTIASMREWIVADIPMSDARFGLLTSVFLWIYGLVSPVGGFLADRYSRKWVIIASLGVWSAMTWLTGHMHSFNSLLAARAVMGVSEACYIAAALALIADYHTGATRSFATGLHQSGLYAGAALGGAGGWIAGDHGWRLAFTLFGALGVAYAIVLLFLLRDQPRAQDKLRLQPSQPVSARAIVRELAASRSYGVLMVYIGLAGMAFWLINGWLPTYLQENFAGWRPGGALARVLPSAWIEKMELTRGTAGLWATVPVQVASFLGILVGGVWADRWGRTNPRSRMLIPALGFCCAGPCLLLLAKTSSFSLALVAMTIFGLGRGFADANLMPIVCQVINPRYCATAYGLLNLVGVSVGGGMIYVGGWLRDLHVGLAMPFTIAASGLFLAGLMLFAVRGRQPQLHCSE
ncbi:MFS transporter [Horticoccus sp. 23ND18S-11]|uniref:MFS transporter n=1 Tax=Horticoccus sp. 23ND18S-11 TaxID=3391832 RepID=UPI0039C94E68